MSEREILLTLRDKGVRICNQFVIDYYDIKLAELDAKEAKEREDVQHTLAFCNGWKYCAYVPETEPFFARMKRLSNLITEEIKPMNDVFLHCNAIDSYYISNCPAFESSYNYKGALPNELGRIQTPRGAVMRFIMDIEESTEFVTTRKVTYKIKK
jgi:hypothetical protein